MRSISTILVLLTCGLIGCSGLTEPQQHSSGVETPNFEACQIAEQHLQQLCRQDPNTNILCCQVAAPTKLGKTFAQFCREKESQGVGINPNCLASVTECSEMDTCTVSEAK